jgi:hypothetical protein
MLDRDNSQSLFLFDLGFSASLNQQAGTSDSNRLKIFLSTASFIEDSGIVYSFWSSGNLTGIILSPKFRPNQTPNNLPELRIFH